MTPTSPSPNSSGPSLPPGSTRLEPIPWDSCPSSDPLAVVDQLTVMEKQLYDWGKFTHTAFLTHHKFS
jgi:hypothetical protein